MYKTCIMVKPSMCCVPVVAIYASSMGVYTAAWRVKIHHPKFRV